MAENGDPETAYLPTLRQEALPNDVNLSEKETDKTPGEGITKSADVAGDHLITLIAHPFEKLTAWLHLQALKYRTVAIILLFCMAALCSGMHHLFNTCYNNKLADVKVKIGAEVPIQSWTTGLAVFLEKTFVFFCLTAAGFAFVAMLWRRLRFIAVTPQQIDAAFSLPKNILAFRILFKAPELWFVGLVAVVMWLVPISTLQSVGSMSTKAEPIYQNDTCLIPVPNFQQTAQSERTDYAYYRVAGGLTTIYGQSLTMNDIAGRALVRQDFANFDSPCGVNCSYVTPFQAPSLKCDTSDVGFAQELAAANPGQLIDFTFCQGYNVTCPFWQSAYAVEYSDSERIVPVQDVWSLKWTNGAANCTVYNTTYYLNVTYTGSLIGPSSITALNSTLENQITYTALENTNLTAAVFDNPDQYPSFFSEANMLMLVWAAAQSVGQTFPYTVGVNNSINYGELLFSHPSVLNNGSGEVLLSNFIHLNDTKATAVTITDNIVTYNEMLQIDPNIPQALNSFLLNTTLSLLASDPTHSFIQYQNATCTTALWRVVYVYNSWVLWRSYMPALIACGLICLVGCFCVARGEESGASFTDFAKTLQGFDIHSATQGQPNVKVLLKSGVSAGSDWGFRLFDV